MAVLFVILTIIVVLTVDYAVQRVKRHAAAAPTETPVAAPPPRPVALTTAPPPSTFVTPSHAWLDLLPSGSVRMGVDALVATLVGSPDDVTCAPEGASVARGAPLVTLRKGERELVLRAPLDGVVEKVKLPADPQAFARQPYGAAWICQLRPRAVGPALRTARIGDEAGNWLRAELSRLRDFLCGVTTAHGAAVAVAADGGYPLPGTAVQLDSESWDRLVGQFFGEGEDPQRSTRQADDA